MSEKTLERIAFEAQMAASGCGLEHLWDDPRVREEFRAGANAVAERCAEIADVWAKTEPQSGDLAPLIATVSRETGRKIANEIRNLKNASVPDDAAPHH